MSDHLVFYSGGVASFWAAHRVIEAVGRDSVRLLFTDTMIEDADLYRFLDETESYLGVKVERIADGRTPFGVFRDVRLLGNSMMDPCSRVLKRELARKWVRDHYAPEDVTLVMGMDWSEGHRIVRTQEAWKPYRVIAPLDDAPYLTKADMIADLARIGIDPPRLYALGFPHNNCGGACVKAGKAHWRHLLRTLPDVYARWESFEGEMREMLGKDVAILKESVDGQSTPITLASLRARVESQTQMTFDDIHDWGGCGCMAGDV